MKCYLVIKTNDQDLYVLTQKEIYTLILKNSGYAKFVMISFLEKSIEKEISYQVYEEMFKSEREEKDTYQTVNTGFLKEGK